MKARPTRPIDITVNKRRCHTCPFGERGAKDVRRRVEARCLTLASQLCHGTKNRTLCRGARDIQLTVFFRLGVIAEPTDAAWMAAAGKMRSANASAELPALATENGDE